MLEERIKVYKELKDQDRRLLYEYKYTTEKQFKQEYEWLSEPEFNALQQSRLDLISAYSNFFNSLKGTRKGAKVGFPKFQKKGHKNSFRTPNNHNNMAVDFSKSTVKLPKLGWIPFRDKRTSFAGKIKQATVSRSKTGKYFVSLLFEQDFEAKPIMFDSINKEKVIGLDMSLDKFYVDNYGNSPNYTRFYRESEPKLAKAQRKCSKKVKGSKNRQKSQLKVNRIYEKIANSRKDFTQKLSSKLIADNDAIVVETLSLAGMSQALKLGKSVMDLGYSDFVSQLQYKSLQSNKLLIEADKWFASSKTCNFCGFKKDLLLQERTWTCPNCGRSHNRDQNAGINLKNYGLRELGLVGQGLPDFKPVEKKVTGQDVNSVINYASVKQEAVSYLTHGGSCPCRGFSVQHS